MPQSFQAPVRIGEHEKKLAAEKEHKAAPAAKPTDEEPEADHDTDQPKKGKGKK